MYTPLLKKASHINLIFPKKFCAIGNKDTISAIKFSVGGVAILPIKLNTHIKVKIGQLLRIPLFKIILRDALNLKIKPTPKNKEEEQIPWAKKISILPVTLKIVNLVRLAKVIAIWATDE